MESVGGVTRRGNWGIRATKSGSGHSGSMRRGGGDNIGRTLLVPLFQHHTQRSNKVRLGIHLLGLRVELIMEGSELETEIGNNFKKGSLTSRPVDLRPHRSNNRGRCLEQGSKR